MGLVAAAAWSAALFGRSAFMAAAFPGASQGIITSVGVLTVLSIVGGWFVTAAWWEVVLFIVVIFAFIVSEATQGTITLVGGHTIRFKGVGFVAAAPWLAAFLGTFACTAAAFPGASQGNTCAQRHFLGFYDAFAHRGCKGGGHVAFWAKASPRLDVDETPSTVARVLPPGSCLCLGNLDLDGEDEERKREKEKEKGEVSSCLPVHASCSSCPNFLRTLSGRTVVMHVADCTTHKLLQRIENVTRIPQPHWYCRVNGSPLPEGGAKHGLRRDCTVVMCARLKGGAPAIPGEWFCQVCQRAGAGQRAHIDSGAAARRVNKHFEARCVGRAPPTGLCWMSNGASACSPAGAQKTCQY